MGFEDLVNKGRDALNSEQGEQMSDQAIQRGGDAFDNATGGRFAEHIDTAQQHADGSVGEQGAVDAQADQGDAKQQQDQAQQ